MSWCGGGGKNRLQSCQPLLRAALAFAVNRDRARSGPEIDSANLDLVGREMLVINSELIKPRHRLHHGKGGKLFFIDS